LVWVERERFQGWTCSVCGWEFKLSGPLTGKTIDEMKRAYELQRDEQFKAHVCAKPQSSPLKSR
jgi:rubredoxin